MNLIRKVVDSFIRTFFGSSKSSTLLLPPASNEIKVLDREIKVMVSKVERYNNLQKKIDNIVKIPNGIDGVIVFHDGNAVMNTEGTRGKGTINMDEALRFSSQMFEIYDNLKKESELRNYGGDNYDELETVSLKFTKAAFTLGVAEYRQGLEAQVAVLFFGLLEPKRLSTIHSNTSESERILVVNDYYSYLTAND